MGITELVLLACVVLSVGAASVQEESRTGAGDKEGGESEQEAGIQPALHMLQTMLADKLAAPAQLWAAHAEEVRARVSALEKQMNEVKEHVMMVLAAYGMGIAQFLSEHPELKARLDAITRHLQKHEAEAETSSRSSHQPPAPPQEDQISHTYHVLSDAVARAQEDLARLWAPAPTSTPTPAPAL